MKDTLVKVFGGLLLVGVVGWAFWNSFSTPGGDVKGYEQGPGLESACTILPPDLLNRLVPSASPSHRTLDRRLSSCTLSGGGKTLTIEINDHSTTTDAESSYRHQESISARFARAFLPPVEHPKLGDQALVQFSYDNTATKAMLYARHGNRMIQIGYSTPPALSGNRTADPANYQAAREAVQAVAGELLK